MINETAIILCGGKGRRLESLGERLPKTLAPVHGRPILWYILLQLHGAGFRHFVLPLGYRGGDIRKFIAHDLRDFDARIETFDTGDDAPIGRRLSLVRDAVGGDHFLLVNGDTLFDFDVAGLVAGHRSSAAELTLTSCRVVSQYGLLLIDEAGAVKDFAGNSLVNKVIVDGRERLNGFVNAGIVVLARHALDMPGIATAPDFEQHLYPRIIAGGRARHAAIEGFWHAIDTQKDLDVANSSSDSDPRALGARLLAERLTAYASKLGLPR